MVKDWTQRIAISTGAVATIGLLSAWMAPNTALVQRETPPSASPQPQALRATYSPVAADAIPSPQALLATPPTPTLPTMPVAVATDATTEPPPDQAAAAPSDPQSTDTGDQLASDEPRDAPTPPADDAAPSQAPAVSGPTEYAAARARWQERMASYRQQADQAAY